MFRKATAADAARITALYEAVHDGEEAGRISTGWLRGVYPTAATVDAALARGDLFVETEGGTIVAVGVINGIQMPEYADCPWKFAGAPEEVMVLHTLAVDPAFTGRGYARAFVRFYEEYAAAHGCRCLRIDTQAINTAARALYASLGYREADTVGCVFNGIPDVKLVLLEKQLGVSPALES